MYPTKKLWEVWEITTWYTPSKNNQEFWWWKTLFVKPPHLKGWNIITYTEETLSDLWRKKWKLIKKNSIMVCCIGSLWKVWIAWEELCTNQQINSIYFDEKIVNFKYWYYFCITLEKTMNLMANKAVVAIINKSLFSTIPIPLPPLPTQKLIVQKLDQAFEKIDKNINLTKENLKILEELNKSVLEKVFSEWEYERKKLWEVCDFKNWYAFKSNEFNEKWNWLQVIRIWNVLNLNKNIVFINENIKFNEFKLFQNDIIIGLTWTRQKRDYLLPWIILENNKYYLNQRVWRLRPLENLFYKFLYFYLKTDLFRDKIFVYETWTVNQWNLSWKDILNQIIPLPPLQKQKEIVSYLDQVFEKNKELKTKYEEQLKELEEMKQSLLKDAFEGKLVKE